MVPHKCKVTTKYAVYWQESNYYAHQTLNWIKIDDGQINECEIYNFCKHSLLFDYGLTHILK